MIYFYKIIYCEYKVNHYGQLWDKNTMKNNFLFTSHPQFMVGVGSHQACFLTHTSFGFSTFESPNVYILSPSMNLSLSPSKESHWKHKVTSTAMGTISILGNIKKNQLWANFGAFGASFESLATFTFFVMISSIHHNINEKRI